MPTSQKLGQKYLANRQKYVSKFEAFNFRPGKSFMIPRLSLQGDSRNFIFSIHASIFIRRMMMIWAALIPALSLLLLLLQRIFILSSFLWPLNQAYENSKLHRRRSAERKNRSFPRKSFPSSPSLEHSSRRREENMINCLAFYLFFLRCSLSRKQTFHFHI